MSSDIFFTIFKIRTLNVGTTYFTFNVETIKCEISLDKLYCSLGICFNLNISGKITILKFINNIMFAMIVIKKMYLYMILYLADKWNMYVMLTVKCIFVLTMWWYKKYDL